MKVHIRILVGLSLYFLSKCRVISAHSPNYPSKKSGTTNDDKRVNMLGAPWRRFAASTSALLLSAGCASTQLNYNTVEISSTIDSVYVRQTLNNLSKFIDDPYAIPSQVIMAGGTIQTVNTVSPSVTFPVTSQLARMTQIAPTGVTQTSTNTAAGASGTVGGSNAASQNYTIAPLNDANILRNQQALYRHAVFGKPLRGNYHVPRIFFQDKFYDDPYQLQFPHCVLCAVEQGVFSGQPHPQVRANPALLPKWLYWDTDPYLNNLLSRGETVYLGHYGNHDLFMSRADYEAGALTNFVMFTLPNTEPVEVITPVVHLTPGTPGAAGAATTVPNNTRMFPPGRQGPALVIPQGIQPF
jgi:hypothetical protein